jgi:hypothetical protein
MCQTLFHSQEWAHGLLATAELVASLAELSRLGIIQLESSHINEPRDFFTFWGFTNQDCLCRSYSRFTATLATLRHSMEDFMLAVGGLIEIPTAPMSASGGPAAKPCDTQACSVMPH